jgi:hypothetical protein
MEVDRRHQQPQHGEELITGSEELPECQTGRLPPIFIRAK